MSADAPAPRFADPLAATADLAHIDTWIFDLDNTLYGAQCRLFEEIDARMTAFIEALTGLDHAKARRLQKDYYVRYGTTMSGLMAEHQVAPQAFMEYVHDIDLSRLDPNPPLCDAIASLPGRRFIFTNGSARHAENVCGAIGLRDHFNGVFDIEAANFEPKPRRGPYERFCAQYDVEPRRAIMFEDLLHNLEAPHALGMTTVLVCSQAEWLADEPPAKRPARPGEKTEIAHYETSDLAGFLQSARLAPKASTTGARPENAS